MVAAVGSAIKADIESKMPTSERRNAGDVLCNNEADLANTNFTLRANLHGGDDHTRSGVIDDANQEGRHTPRKGRQEVKVQWPRRTDVTNRKQEGGSRRLGFHPTGITTHDKKLQRGLDVTDKTQRVYHYAKSIRKEVGIIAHSCGVPEPRRLKRFHCRIVQDDGSSKPLDELYPDVA